MVETAVYIGVTGDFEMMRWRGFRINRGLKRFGRKIRRRSDKMKIINEIEAHIRTILKVERGALCELCGQEEQFLPYRLSLFHIMPKSTHKRIRFNKENLLLACWAPYYAANFCHNIYHHNLGSKRGQEILAKIKEIRGEHYETILSTKERLSPRLDITTLRIMLEAYRSAAKELEAGLKAVL